MGNASYKAHNEQYESADKINYEKRWHEYNTANKVQYNPDSPLGKMLDMYPEIKIGVDIGCGTGWVANLMSETKDIVYAIEPSQAAINIAKTLYPSNDKVIWKVGFAQEHIFTLNLEGPALFNCFCVLSHLEDDDVIEICSQINKVAKHGSVLSFSECFGCNYHANLWHIRETFWWQEIFSDWQFDFFGPSLGDSTGGRKAFSAIRMKGNSK